MNFLTKTLKGIGDLPGYGPHPGTPIFLIFVFLGAVAGLDGGFLGAFVGAGLLFSVMGILYFRGAYERYCLYESDLNNNRDGVK